MSAKLGKEEISDEEELQVENEGEKWPIPMVAKVGLILSALLVVYGVLTINTSSFQGMVFIYCIAIGMLLVIWAAYNGYGNMDKKAAYWTIIAALVSFPIIKGADYLFANDETEEKETELVEQKQESPAEKEAREKKEKEERQKDRINEIKRSAEREARITAQSLRYTESWPKHCQDSYISAFGTPSSDEDYKMYDVYKEEFRKKYFATLDAQQKMN